MFGGKNLFHIFAELQCFCLHKMIAQIASKALCYNAFINFLYMKYSLYIGYFIFF